MSMCHEMPNGVTRLSKFLRMDAQDIEARASGINHFTFFTEMRDRRTGEDLLPRVRELFERRVFDYPGWTVALTKEAHSASHRWRHWPMSCTPPWLSTWFVSTASFRARSTATSASTSSSPGMWPTGTPPGWT